MKKIKLLTPILSIGVAASTIAPLASCSCNQTTSPVTLDQSLIDKGFSVKSCKLEYLKDSFIELNTPDNKPIENVEVKVGDITITKGEHLRIDGKTIWIEGYYMVASKVTIKSITLVKYKSNITAESTTKEWTKGSTIKAKDVTVNLVYDDKSVTPLDWNTGYTISKDDAQIINFDTIGYTFTQADLIKGNATFKVNYVQDASMTATFDVSVVTSDTFNGVRWNIVAQACNEFEAIASPTKDDAIVLCKKLGVKDPIASNADDAKTVLENNLVGLEGITTINNLEHKVRCIGAMHDKITGTNTKSALTFEMVTLLSGDNRLGFEGRAMSTMWDDYNQNNNYTNSRLRKNLTGEGSCDKVEWYQWDAVWVDTVVYNENKTALELLTEGNPTLGSAIKKVEKSVATKKDEESGWVVTAYSDKLFPLTITEMAAVEAVWSTHLEEGTPYKYWANNEAQSDPDDRRWGREKIDFAESDEYGYYWLSTPDTDGDNVASSVCGNYSDESIGEINSDWVNEPYCTNSVSFAFCI